LEKCLAYSHSIEERAEWKKKYTEILNQHSASLERILKSNAPSNFIQGFNVQTGVDWMKDEIFTYGWMKKCDL